MPTFSTVYSSRKEPIYIGLLPVFIDSVLYIIGKGNIKSTSKNFIIEMLVKNITAALWVNIQSVADELRKIAKSEPTVQE